MGWVKNAITTLKWMELAKFVWDLILFVFSLGLVKKALSYIPQISTDWAWLIALCVASAVLFLLIRSQEKKGLSQQPMQSASTSLATASNALSRGVPYDPGFFDSVDFFRTAYYSPLQDVAANSLRAEAERVRPKDKESFYLDVLAVGMMSLIYNDIWWPLYRSQLRALSALNNQNGLVPIGAFRKFYEEAAKEFESEYKSRNISFEEWIAYLTRNMLLIIHPSQMVEITLRGKDFLKYLLHWGRSENVKRL